MEGGKASRGRCNGGNPLSSQERPRTAVEREFDIAKTEAVILTRRRGDKQPKLRQTLNIGGHPIRFNKEATRWLGIWLDSGLRFKEHHQKHMAKAHAADRRLQSLTGGTA